MTAASGSFITGSGEMGTLTRNFDWARTPVGPAESWPQNLRTALSILEDILERTPLDLGSVNP